MSSVTDKSDRSAVMRVWPTHVYWQWPKLELQTLHAHSKWCCLLSCQQFCGWRAHKCLQWDDYPLNATSQPELWTPSLLLSPFGTSSIVMRHHIVRVIKSDINACKSKSIETSCPVPAKSSRPTDRGDLEGRAGLCVVHYSVCVHVHRFASTYRVELHTQVSHFGKKIWVRWSKFAADPSSSVAASCKQVQKNLMTAVHNEQHMRPVQVHRSDVQNINASSTTVCLMWRHLLLVVAAEQHGS